MRLEVAQSREVPYAAGISEPHVRGVADVMETSRNPARRRSIENEISIEGGAKEALVSRMNIIAIIVIVLVLTGGAAALYRLDTGDGTRTSQAISARTASD